MTTDSYGLPSSFLLLSKVGCTCKLTTSSTRLIYLNSKFVNSRTCVDWIELKFLKFFLNVRVVSSTIGKPIKLNPTDYYHLIFTQKKRLYIFMLYLYKNFIVLNFIYLLLLILLRCKLNLFVTNLNLWI